MSNLKVITTDLLSTIETALGNAYSALTDGVGNIEDSSSSLYDITKAKLIVRGGTDSEFSVKGSISTSPPIIPPAEALGFDVTVPGTSVYFGGEEKTVPTTTVSVWNDVANTPSPEDGYFYGVYLYAFDESTPAADSVTVQVVPSVSAVTPVVSLIKSATERPSLAELFPPNYKPYDVPTTAVLLAKIVVGTLGVASTDILYDETKVGFYESTNDDDVVESLFSQLNSVEDSIAATNFSEEFSGALTALDTHTKNRTGVSFKDYWKSQDYIFTDNFRKLWSSAKNQELSTKMALVYPAGGDSNNTYSPIGAYKPTVIEAVLPDYTSTGITLSAILYNEATYSTVLRKQASITAGTGSLYVKEAINSWPPTGYMVLSGRSRGTGFSAGAGHELVLVGTYDRTSSATIVPFQRLPHCADNLFDPWRTTVYPANLFSLTFAAASPSGSSKDVATIPYTNVAYASISQGTSTLGVLLRSK